MPLFKIQEEIERDLYFLGITAVEDKLQVFSILNNIIFI